MLFIQPAVVPADDGAHDVVAEVRTVPKPVKTGVPTNAPTWTGEVQLAQASSGPNSLGTGTTPGAPVPEPPRANILPGGGSQSNPFGSSTNPVGASPVLPNQPNPNPASTPGGNTYGTQQEGSTGAAPTAPIAPTAPVSPGIPGPGAGTAGNGGTGLATPPLGNPPAGNVDTGSSSFQNPSSPYNSTGSGAGVTGTGMGTTAAPPNPGTSAAPPIPAPTTSGASGTP
jgi:hypothetical protein